MFSGDDVAQLRNLGKVMDVVIEGPYRGITHFLYIRDLYRLVGCLLTSIETPQNWTVPMTEDMKDDAIHAGHLVNVQARFRRGDTVRIFGSVYSVAVDWSYLEGIWADVVVTIRLDFGTEREFSGEEVFKVLQLPEGQQVIVEGQYDRGSASRAFLTDCTLTYP